jgi:cellulose synthase/poly-beta-1,6-N-acetylglucosamine synthase-like glycosyltransferase
MLNVLLWVVAGLSVPLLVCVAVLTAEMLAALLPLRRRGFPENERPNCAVLIPAHNEAAGIARTIAGIRRQLRPGDRILVVADNCTDGTAACAREAGAQVVVRFDRVRRGKGYALDYGIRQLDSHAPAVVVIVDADCALEAGALDHLVRTAVATNRPVQAAYVMDVPPDGNTRSQLSAFLFALKNVIRPRGLARLGLPCLLTGTGMAFPWELIRGAPLASGNLVEDMQLGIDLALAGRAPVFCPSAVVRSELPVERSAAASQRTRWVHGHLRTIAGQAPRLFAAAVRQRRAGLLGLALELSVPPLSLLLFGLMSVAALLAAGWFIGGSGIPAALAAMSIGLLGSVLLLVGFRFGREHLSAAGLLAIPAELLRRLPIFIRFLAKPESTWVRTARRTTP